MKSVNKALKKIAKKSTSFDLNEALIKFMLERKPEKEEPKIGDIVYFKTQTLKNREMVDVYLGAKVKSMVFDTKSTFRFYKLIGSDGNNYVLPINKPDGLTLGYETIKEYFIKNEEEINDPERWAF